MPRPNLLAVRVHPADLRVLIHNAREGALTIEAASRVIDGKDVSREMMRDVRRLRTAANQVELALRKAEGT